MIKQYQQQQQPEYCQHQHQHLHQHNNKNKKKQYDIIFFACACVSVRFLPDPVSCRSWISAPGQSFGPLAKQLPMEQHPSQGVVAQRLFREDPHEIRELLHHGLQNIHMSKHIPPTLQLFLGNAAEFIVSCKFTQQIWVSI